MMVLYANKTAVTEQLEEMGQGLNVRILLTLSCPLVGVLLYITANAFNHLQVIE